MCFTLLWKHTVQCRLKVFSPLCCLMSRIVGLKVSIDCVNTSGCHTLTVLCNVT